MASQDKLLVVTKKDLERLLKRFQSKELRYTVLLLEEPTQLEDGLLYRRFSFYADRKED